MNRIYLYVDGESHFSLANHCLVKLHGNDYPENGIIRYFGGGTPIKVEIEKRYSFFWDVLCIRQDLQGYLNTLMPSRMYYFTSFTGTTDNLFEAHQFLRLQGFEPQIVSEPKDLLKSRANSLNKNAIIIKPKGVDTKLAVTLLEDAYGDLFDICILLTSDADFIPSIEAVKRRGKRVVVVGHGECLAKNSPMYYLPEKFIDIGINYCRNHYHLKPGISHPNPAPIPPDQIS